MSRGKSTLTEDMKRIVIMALAGLCCLTLSWSISAAEMACVSPRPQVEQYGEGMVVFNAQAVPFQVSFRNTGPAQSRACESGLKLLSKRLEVLGAGKATLEEERGAAQVVITRYSPAEFAQLLHRQGAREPVTGKLLEQAYTLVCGPAYRNRGSIQISACGEFGLYYALVSLCQLLDRDGQRGVSVPVVKLADWPAIGLRLSKTSASTAPLPELQEDAEWLPLYKLNVMGLQFHGTNSNQTETFRTNVKAICNWARQSGVLETVVYFCPFRGKAYDFTTPADQERYARFLQWMLDQGAEGIEVDYNDWPGRGVPIEDVINLACRAVAEKNPHAYVLYCPPSRGTSMYRGPASAEMRRILSNVPTNVWPLWTGPATRNALIEQPIEPVEVENWTRAAGRRPFLWVNRVGPHDRHNHPFSRAVPEVPGAFAFRGDLLPKDLDRLFEGVHFNGHSASKSDPETVAYLATAADFVWNPRGWEAVESCRRAKHFVEVMAPVAGP
jgi:hypothetical protein